MQTSIATDVLTPSEVVLVHGERFSKPEKNGYTVPRGGAVVDSDTLGNVALQAALLANEQAGAIRLEEGTEKRIFGLFKSKVIRAVLGASEPEWPEGSFEAQIHERVKAQGAGEGIEIRALVIALFSDDVPNPASSVLDRVCGAMHLRGLTDVETRETKSLKIFTVKSTVSVLNAAGTALAGRYPAEPARELLTSFARTRPDAWKLIEAAIRSGLTARQEMQDYDSGGSSFD